MNCLVTQVLPFRLIIPTSAFLLIDTPCAHEFNRHIYVLIFSPPPTCNGTSDQSEPEGWSQGSSLHGSIAFEEIEEERGRQECKNWYITEE